MLNSRDINLLRSDVKANCEIWLKLCKQSGLNVLITGTVRDDEYQLYCYNNGFSKGKIPTFHSVKAGLAFDFCRNIKGQEYSDLSFFKKAADIAKTIGFTWGGDWTSFVDRPHLQWDQHGKYTSSMILKGQYPPAMPLYKIKGDDDVTKEEVQKMIDSAVASLKAELNASILQTQKNLPAYFEQMLKEHNSELNSVDVPAEWSKEAWNALKEARLMDGARPLADITRQEVAVIIYRLKTMYGLW